MSNREAVGTQSLHRKAVPLPLHKGGRGANILRRGNGARRKELSPFRGEEVPPRESEKPREHKRDAVEEICQSFLIIFIILFSQFGIDSGKLIL